MSNPQKNLNLVNIILHAPSIVVDTERKVITITHTYIDTANKNREGEFSYSMSIDNARWFEIALDEAIEAAEKLFIPQNMPNKILSFTEEGPHFHIVGGKDGNR